MHARALNRIHLFRGRRLASVVRRLPVLFVATMFLNANVIDVTLAQAPRESRSEGLQWSPIGRGLTTSQFLVEPDRGVRPLVRLLDHAQSRIFVETYILSDRRVVRALERASAQGVAVYVLLERSPFGLGDQPVRMADQLRAAGIFVRWASGSFYLMHAKFMVIDDRVSVVSTANFSRAGFTVDRDFIAVVTTPVVVHEVSDLFRADWDRLPFRLHDVNVPVSPAGSRRMIEALLQSAHVSADIFAEEVHDIHIEQLLIGMAKHGLRVRVLLPKGASPPDVSRLELGGVRVREPVRPYIHAKVIVVDGREAFVGSENLSSTSLDRNREVGILIRGASVRVCQARFARDWKNQAP